MIRRLPAWLCVAVALALVALSVAGAFARGFGPFSDKLELVVLTDRNGPVTRAGRTLWADVRPFTYRTHAGDEITVPAGMVTDLASIPAVVSWLLPPDGPWVQIAVVHDLLYQSRGGCDWRGHPGRTRPEPYTRAEADAVLDQGMQDLGVSGWRRFLIYQGVRLGGRPGWGR